MMTKQTEALKMAIELMERFLEHDSISSSDYIDVRNACIKALEPTVAELNDEYLRDTHVKGMPKEPYNLVAILNDPMRAYPHNFSTPAKGNALLFGLCQEAADEIERLKAETQEPVAWMNDIAFSMDKELLGTRSRIVALYTTPPSREWVGLSDEEIGRLAVFDGLHHVEIPLLAKFIIAIEQALKEKNG